MPPPSFLSVTLQQKTDRCVMCGLCSQHCPTYELTANENESPRGRIALISALNNGQLPISEKLVGHLEHCTGCRACENACPSDVSFGAIMDEAWALIEKRRPLPRHRQQMQAVLANPQQTKRLGRWLERYQRWGLQRLMRASGLLSLAGMAKSEGLLPTISQTAIQPEYSPAWDGQGINKRGDVALFTGCISSIVDRDALNASRQLLNRLGYGVITPVGQTCCGALHQHSGQTDKAAELAQTNLAVFGQLDVEAILHTSTACTCWLKEYGQLLEKDSKQPNTTTAFTKKVKDINQFLTGIDWPSNLVIRPLSKRVAVHEPCSARNVLHDVDSPYRLLKAIPGIECIPLPDNVRCCGAAGGQLLSPSSLAQSLRQKKLDALSALTGNPDRQAVDILVTTNIGCALHLAAGLREQGQHVEVLHPVTLLMRQLEPPESETTEHTNPVKTCTSPGASAKVTG